MIRATVATLAALLLAVSLTVAGTPRPAVAATCVTNPPDPTAPLHGHRAATAGTTATSFTFLAVDDQQATRAYANVT